MGQDEQAQRTSLSQRVEALERTLDVVCQRLDIVPYMAKPLVHSWLDGAALKAKRLEAKLSLRDVAADLRIPHKRVHRWESGAPVCESDARILVSLFPGLELIEPPKEDAA